MESDKPDLNSILESARAQLEMYRRASQEDLTEPTKEIILARSKDQVMEDVSGPLFERAKESAGTECARVASGKSVGSPIQSAEETKDEQDSRVNSEMEEDGVEVEGEESSNKNFDSSTMTLGDQQSFQNQAELTSQTTYTNIHEYTGPVKDEILVVTGPTTEPLDEPPSTVSQHSQSEATPINLTTTSMITPAIEELNKIEDAPQNQMASIRSWKSDPCRDAHQETIITETFPQEKEWDEAVDKGDAVQVAGAGTREGSPVRPSAKLIQEVAQRLSQLEVKGNRCSWLNQKFKEEGEEINEMISKDPVNVGEESGSKTVESKHEVRGRGYSIFDNPIMPHNFMSIPTTVENKQIDFVQHFDEKDINNCDATIGRVSDKSIFEDEGFVDSKELMDSTKIIFVSDEEDEQSCKPFETEDDTSCLLEPSSAGRSLDLQSDLEAKPSLTDVHPLDQLKSRENSGEADADSNRILSLETLRPSLNEEQSLIDGEVSQDLKNYDNGPVEEKCLQLTDNTKEPIVNNKLPDTESVKSEKPRTSEPNINVKECDSNKKKDKIVEEGKSSSSPQTPSSSPRIVQCHNKSTVSSPDYVAPKKKTTCIGRALFEMFHKSIAEGKSPLPPHLTKILQEAYANELPQIACTTTVPLVKEHTSSTDFESAYESSDQGQNDPSTISKDCCLIKSDVNLEYPRTEMTSVSSDDKDPKIMKPIPPTNLPSIPRLNLMSNNLPSPFDLRIRPSLPITRIDQLESDISNELPQIPDDSISGLSSENTPSLSNQSNETTLTKDVPTTCNENINRDMIETKNQSICNQNRKVDTKMENNETKIVTQSPPKIFDKNEDETDVTELRKTDFEPSLFNDDFLSSGQEETDPLNDTLQNTKCGNRGANPNMPILETDNLITDKPLSLLSGTEETVISEIDGQMLDDVQGPMINNIKGGGQIRDLASLSETEGSDERSPSTRTSIISALVDKENELSGKVSSIDDGDSCSQVPPQVSPNSVSLSGVASTEKDFGTIEDSPSATQPDCDVLPEMSEFSDNIPSALTSAESFSIPGRPVPLNYASDLSVREERPLTPYVSQIRGPTPDISHYMEEPLVPVIRAPAPMPELRAQATAQTNVQPIPIESGVTVKSPPRPPPRARQQTQPKKKINFFKKLFGLKTKSSN